MIVKLQCSFAADTMLPRDRLVITPHFEVPATGYDGNGLCLALAQDLGQWGSNTREVIVTSYDAQGTKPVFPNGRGMANENQCPASTVPREVACCLSYYANQNVPRRRGRLYIPLAVMQLGTALRPAQAVRDKVAALADIFAGVGGLNVDWVVWSPTDGAAHKVTNWWVDDEWDTVRSRGLRATTRLAGTTSG